MTDEPRIIEEKIVARAASGGAGSNSTDKAGADTDALPKVTVFNTSVPASTDTPREIAAITPQAPELAAPLVPPPPPIPPAAPPAPPIPAPEPKPIAVPLTPATSPAGLHDDIAKILKDVKLPEHRTDAKPSAPAGAQAPAFGALPQFEGPPQRSVPPREPPAVVTPQNSAAEEAADVPSSVQSLHTMKNDLQEVVTESKISIVRAASMEQDRRNKAVPIAELQPKKRGKFGLILAATLVLILLAGAVLFALQWLQNTRSNTQNTAQQSLLFAESQTTLSLDNESSSSLRPKLGALLSGYSASVGSITEVIPTLAATDTPGKQRAATLAEFFSALGANPPDSLVRALSDQFFFGIHMADSPAPLFIIPVTSYDNAFAGMLAWENTMDSDLAPLFKQVPAVVPSASGGLPVARQFQDLVVRNYDVRGLEDDSGTIVLYYSFPTPNLLIIAGSAYTFPEVLSRLQAEHKL